MATDKNTAEKMFCPGCEREFEPGLNFCPHDGTKLIQRSQDEMAGQTLDGRYKILHKLGEGGMGKVYKAEQVATGKTVAIKIVAQHLSKDEATIKRFRREVAIQSKLEHPNIVTVIDFSQLTSGEFYFVMAFVKGASLQNLILEHGRVTLKDFFDYAIQLCDGIEYAHRLGIIHRDLKGDNIIITPMGHQKVLKILDFGIAKALLSAAEGDSLSASSAQLTQQGRIMGTPAYMAPEQAKGDIKNIGPTTDVYAIGVLMFQMLAGKLPYESDTPWGLMHKHITAPIPHIPVEGEALRELDPVISKCLEKEPENRYQTALDLKDALETLKMEYARPSHATRHPTPAAPATAEKTSVYKPPTPDQAATMAYKQAPPGAPHDKVKIAVFAIMILLILISGGGAVWYFTHGKAPERIAQPAEEIPGDIPAPPAAEPTAQTPPPPAEPKPREPSPEEIKAGKISGALETAEKRFANGALARPEGESALDAYKAALLLDPGNKEAQAGIDKVGGRLVALVNESIDKQNLGVAEDYLIQAEKYAPAAKGAKAAREKLNGEKALQAQALAALEKEKGKQKIIGDLLKEGEARFAAGALAGEKGAIRSFQKVLEIAPGHPGAYKSLEKASEKALALAVLALEKKDYAKAQENMEIARSASPASEEVVKMREKMRAQIEAEEAEKKRIVKAAEDEARRKVEKEAQAKREAEETKRKAETAETEKARLAKAAEDEAKKKTDAEAKKKTDDAQKAEEAKKRAEAEEMKKKAEKETQVKEEPKEAPKPKETVKATPATAPSGEMANIQGGCFEMGDTFGEGEPEEKPAHKVCLKDFHLDRHEVTQAAFQKTMGGNPSKFSDCPRCPVDSVLWDEADKFCKTAGKRLPTEAEWEFAARDRGKNVRFATGKDILTSAEANFNAASKIQRYSEDGQNIKKTTPVGGYPPNALGLYDMNGNVWEWVADWYDRTYYANGVTDSPAGPDLNKNNIKVIRGGSWFSTAYSMRVSVRDRYDAGRRQDQIGFRCAR